MKKKLFLILTVMTILFPLFSIRVWSTSNNLSNITSPDEWLEEVNAFLSERYPDEYNWYYIQQYSEDEWTKGVRENYTEDQIKSRMEAAKLLAEQYNSLNWDELEFYTRDKVNNVKNGLDTCINMDGKIVKIIEAGPSYKGETAESLWQLAINFLHKGSSEESLDLEKVSKPFVKIGQLLMTVAIVVLTIATLVMGIKYMIATPDKKATIKKQLIGLIVSALVIFSAYTIWSIAVNLLTESVEGEPSTQTPTIPNQSQSQTTTTTPTPPTPTTSLTTEQQHYLNLSKIANTTNPELWDILDFYTDYNNKNTITAQERQQALEMKDELENMDIGSVGGAKTWLLNELQEIANKPTPTPTQTQTPGPSRPPTTPTPTPTQTQTPGPGRPPTTPTPTPVPITTPTPTP